jgi:hypothetical protein
MKLVSRFESHLLRVLDFFLRRVPVEQAMPIVNGAWPQPECLSTAAVELIEDRLAKGCTLFLAGRGGYAGGWRRERFLRGDQVVEGRLWQRTPPAQLALSFSRHTLRFLLWITAHQPGAAETPKWSAPDKEQTIADRLFFYLAYSALRTTPIHVQLAARRGFRDNALCRLAFPEDFHDFHPVPDFLPWTNGLGACILEALQQELTERWVASERSKGETGEWARLRRHGQAQNEVLEAFLTAVESAGRRDLARFLLDALSRLLTPDATAILWVNAPATTGVRLADRVETYRAALALVRQVDRFEQWDRQARSVGYFDEGYAASQLAKADWERAGGTELVARAARIIRELDPINLG